MKKYVLAAGVAAMLATGCATSHSTGPSCAALAIKNVALIGKAQALVMRQPKGWQPKFHAYMSASDRIERQMRNGNCKV